MLWNFKSVRVYDFWLSERSQVVLVTVGCKILGVKCYKRHAEIYVFNYLSDLVDNWKVFLANLTETRHLELRSWKELIVTADQVVELAFMALLKTGFVGQVVHFNIEILYETLKISVEVIKKLNLSL